MSRPSASLDELSYTALHEIMDALARLPCSLVFAE